MDDMIESRLEVCADHPKQQNIFFLEKMLLEAGFPYYFNFWDDLRPTPYNQEGGDPEKDIDWDNYHFIIELEHGAGMLFPLMSVELDPEGNLILMDAREAAAAMTLPENLNDVAVFYEGLTPEQAMEIIEKFFDSL